MTVDRAAASLNQRFNRLSLQLRGSLSDISYEPPVSSVAAVSDRDYQNATETLRATWEFKPTLLAFAEFGLDQRNYDVAAASDGIERTSTGERYDSACRSAARARCCAARRAWATAARPRRTTG